VQLVFGPILDLEVAQIGLDRVAGLLVHGDARSRDVGAELLVRRPRSGVSLRFYLVGVAGFEPATPAPERGVLPLGRFAARG
jgi:hypothetical protein